MKNQEIERKWLMAGFPDMPEDDSCYMEQGYLSFGPITVRIRKTEKRGNCRYMITLKGGGTLARTEVETDLDEAQYEALKALMLGPPAEKQMRFYRLPDGHMLECSRVDAGSASEFYFAEVEFDTVEEAHAFIPPDCLGREVTEKKGYSMAAYCRAKAKNAHLGEEGVPTKWQRL